MINPLDILRQMNIYLPFVCDDFEVSASVLSASSIEYPNETLINLTLDDATQANVGLHYHLKDASLRNPIIDNEPITATLHQLTFQNYHNITKAILYNDNKTITLSNGTGNQEYEVHSVIDEYSLVVISNTAINEVEQKWALNSETAWAQCIVKNGNDITLRMGAGYAYTGAIDCLSIILSQNVYIAPTPDAVIDIYSTLPNKKACFIVFGDRVTLANNKNDAGEVSRNNSRQIEDLRVSTEITLFVVYPHDSQDEKHIKATIDAYSTMYDKMNACLFGYTSSKTNRQITPTNSGGGVSGTDRANYIHQYSFQAIDYINIVDDGLYYDKTQDDEVLRKMDISLRFKTELDGQLSDILTASIGAIND